MKQKLIVGGSVGAVVLLVLAMFPVVAGIDSIGSTKLFRSTDADELCNKNINEIVTYIFGKINNNEFPGFVTIIMWIIVMFFALIIELNSS